MSKSSIYTIEIKGGGDPNRFAKKFMAKDNLSYIRKKLGKSISDDVIFVLPDETIIRKEDEKEFLLEDIVDGQIIHMKMNKIKNTTNFDIYINDKFKTKKEFNKEETLNNVRTIINDIITEKGLFLSKNGVEILKEDENEFTIEDILKIKLI